MKSYKEAETMKSDYKWVKGMENCCYICKIGWISGEQQEIMWERKGLMLCWECYSMMNRRESG